MKKIIFSIVFAKLRKQEFPDVINGVVRIVGSHNPASLGIDAMYKLLVAQQVNMYLLTEKSVSHPLTKVLKALRKRQLNLVKAILKQADAVEKAALDSQASEVALLVPVIRKHLSNLGRENQKVVKQEIVNFLAELKESDSLTTASTVIGVKAFVDELDLVGDSIEDNTNNRRLSKFPKRIINKKQIKLDMIEAYERLMSSIELARVEHPELDYTALIGELNEFLASYQTLTRSRTTQNKQDARKTTTAALSATTSATAI